MYICTNYLDCYPVSFPISRFPDFLSQIVACDYIYIFFYIFLLRVTAERFEYSRKFTENTDVSYNYFLHYACILIPSTV